MSDEALEFLTGAGGPPTVSFPEPGAKIVGQVLKYELVQQRDFATKKPKVWDDGSPMMQAIVTLQAEVDPQDEDDDCRRRLFVKGIMRNAVIGAIRNSGHKGSLVGGRLGVTFVKYGKAKQGMNPPKEFLAKFVPPSPAEMLSQVEGPTGYDVEAPF